MKKIVIVIVAVLLVGGAAAYAFMKDDKKKETSSTNNGAQTESQESAPAETSEGQDQAESVAGDSEVTIEDFAYGPETITVKKGTTVTWTNKDSAGHTVTPDEESDAFVGSELLAQGESYSFTFDEVGSYSYHCQPHPQMTAKVVVTE